MQLSSRQQQRGENMKIEGREKRYARLVSCSKEKGTQKKTKKRNTDNSNSSHEYRDDCSCCCSVCEPRIFFHEYLFLWDSDTSSFHTWGLHSSNAWRFFSAVRLPYVNLFPPLSFLSHSRSFLSVSLRDSDPPSDTQRANDYFSYNLDKRIFIDEKEKHQERGLAERILLRRRRRLFSSAADRTLNNNAERNINTHHSSELRYAYLSVHCNCPSHMSCRYVYKLDCVFINSTVMTAGARAHNYHERFTSVCCSGVSTGESCRCLFRA